MEELQFKLFPGVHHQFTSSTLSKALKRDTQAHIGSTIGIRSYRDIQSNFMEYHPDPHPVMINNTADLQQGHSSDIASQWYNRSEGMPHGTSVAKLKRFQRNSWWWQHISGMWFFKHLYNTQPT